MQLFDLTQSALELALRGAAQRQELLASNLANINTPGYQRRDLDFHAALRGALATGDVEHVAFTPQVDVSAGAVRADGSTVDPDREAAEIAKNGLEYEALARVLRARIAILESAMGLVR
ncbi:flagellar basal body rod protein FlgB [Thermoleophilum album]|jgi:flagellar basal-body rod protein FlgB|uniref:flagellar basal body rod protein FlgB n=1 Tax=Thermoleophilum album TaxID=29539 RepID=UPI00237C9CF2|nr:flagellar basal body rod protein FlgB [Thermoleophilum album]WDT94557.1 flagellar basal body rod protein FlgB [Thermoleophilum album]